MKHSTRIFFSPLGRTIAILAASLLTTPAIAETVYKSVDKGGEVTFSDEPPANAVNVEKLHVQPAPTESQQHESMERAKRMESQANEMGEASAGRAAQRQPVQQQQEQEVQPVETYQDVDPHRRPLIREGARRR
jgi:hypothetical protein